MRSPSTLLCEVRSPGFSGPAFPTSANPRRTPEELNEELNPRRTSEDLVITGHVSTPPVDRTTRVDVGRTADAPYAWFTEEFVSRCWMSPFKKTFGEGTQTQTHDTSNECPV